MRKHLKTDGIKVAIVAKDAARLRELFSSGKPTPITYDTQGTPDDVLAEDKQIAVFPLKDVSVRIVPVEQMFDELVSCPWSVVRCPLWAGEIARLRRAHRPRRASSTALRNVWTGSGRAVRCSCRLAYAEA